MNTLGKKIGFGYGIIVMILVTAVLTTLWKVEGISRITRRLIELRSPTAQSSLMLLNGINHSLAALRGWIILGQDKFREERAKAWSEQIVPSVESMERLSVNWTDSRNVTRLRSIQDKLKLVEGYQEEIERIAQTLDNTPATKILFEQAIPQAHILMESITTMIDIEDKQKANQERKRLLKIMADIRGTTGVFLAAVRAFILAGDEQFKREFDPLWEKNSKAFSALKKKVKLLTPEQRKAFDRLSKARKIFTPLPPQMFGIRSGKDWNRANALLKNKAAPTAQAIEDILEEMLDSQQSLMADDFVELSRQEDVLGIIEWALFFAGAGLGIVLGIRITRSITKPIAATVQLADSIAKGDYAVSIDIGGSVEIESLGRAMNGMRENLKHLSHENEQQLWLANSRTELSRKMRGTEDIVTLSKNIITSMAELLKADIGAVYLSRNGDGDNRVKLLGSYAYTDRENNFNEFQLGEGLIGQAALEKTSILFSNPPDDSARINYGMGETLPGYFLISPILYEGNLKGVISLGAVKEFSPQQRKFVDQVCDDIGIGFNVVQSREKIENLLTETKVQSERLESQQEELQASNAELEEQAKVLQESEEKLKIQQEELQSTNEELRTQQEELQATNEELEEKTKYLEEQKSVIESKNIEVERARKEIEFKALDLEEASRYKSEFLANMSHELRTPLNSLLILAKIFVDNEDDNLTPDQIESAKVIFSSGNDLLALINDILDLSKVESGKMETNIDNFRRVDIIGGIERNFKPVAQKKGIDLHIDSKDGLPDSIRTDGQKVEQILKNLLSNAFKFTEKGSVTVSISRPDHGAEFPDNGLDPKKTIAISVSDSGIGIPQEKQQLIFDAFKQADGTTRRKYGGTGLGLSISKKFARILGGQIGLKSVEGKGSTFTLYLPESLTEAKSPGDGRSTKRKNYYESSLMLEKFENSGESDRTEAVSTAAEGPLVTADEKSASSSVIEREAVSPDEKYMLIIEDDANFAKILCTMANKKGFKGLAAGDGETGLRMAAEYQPKAILLDIMLPGIDGWVVMDRLKDNPATRHIPVHFISALDENLDAMKKGAIGYMAKPVSKEQLDNVFKRIENFIAKDIKNLLVLESDEGTRKDIANMLENKNVNITYVGTGNEAYEYLKSRIYDCMITDVKLSDMPIFALLSRIEETDILDHLPVIVYTDKEITRDEDKKLKRYADSIIVKGVKSKERLLDEVALFLHQVEKEMPEEQQKMLRRLHDKESILKDKKILIVDDDMRNSFALSRVLKKKGMNLLMAENGETGLKMLEKEQGIDLVLMDIMMPVMDGYEAIKKIRKQLRFKDLPILALTAKAMKGDREKCIEAGVNDYLSKPIDVDKLFSMLRIWLYQ